MKHFIRISSAIVITSVSLLFLTGSISKEIGEMQEQQVELYNEINHQNSVIEEQATAYAELSLLHEEMTAEIVELTTENERLQMIIEELERENEKLKK